MPHAQSPAVQFVSKPIVEPFRDGSKCLVRDIALHVQGYTPHLMTAGALPAILQDKAVGHAVYGADGGYAPGLRQNAQAAAFLALRCGSKLWHSVFAPNPRSSQILGGLARLRGARVVQTIASPPLSFEQPDKLLFGDIVVAQSEWTQQQFQRSLEEAQGKAFEIAHIPPPAPQITAVPLSEQRAARDKRGIAADAPVFVYPGDLEVSRGAERVVRMHRAIASTIPGARVLIVYRDKTAQAQEHAQRLARDTDQAVLSFERNVPDLFALLATASAVLFPVESLYGKVDLPIVLLESMRLGTPVLGWHEGPLASLHGALRPGPDDRDWLQAMLRVSDVQQRSGVAAAALSALASHYEPELIAARYAELYARLAK